MKRYRKDSIDMGARGVVCVTPRRNAKNVTLRRNRYGFFEASVPPGIDYSYLLRVLPAMIDRLGSRRTTTGNTPRYSFGWQYEFPEGRIMIEEQTAKPGTIIPRYRGHELILSIHPDIIDNTNFISDSLVSYLKLLAPKYLLPEARQIAARVGVSPSYWSIGRGNRTLGTAHPSDRHISLSRLLVLLPDDLREYVICHELAHLTHFNHSAEFHSLCNSYLNGREKELNTRLRNFAWPVER